jgi:hypothetical protein
VLNHAGGRIYGNKKVDFLGSYDRETFDRFIQFAIKISEAGQLGQRGGSITRSHAFAAKHKVKETYEATGAKLVKDEITCLFWKESLRTSNAIRDRQVDLADYFAHDTRLRFLLPIRNPMDCAVSNLKTDHKYLFRGLPENPTTADMTRAILDEIFWFAGLQREFPDRFFHFFEHQISRELLVELADFLQLSRDETWIQNALATLEIKSGYDHDESLVDSYRDYVNEKGAPFPELSEGLLTFVAGSPGVADH